MGKACGTHGWQERCRQGFGGGNEEKRDYVEDLSLDWTMVLERISYISVEQGVYWIDLAQVS
jgi:hypothetical protein